MLDAKGWEERKTQLGASEVHILFNFDNKGAKDLWLEKIGEVERQQFSNKYTVAGSLIEEEALRFYFRTNNIKTYEINKRMRHFLVKDLVASCDAVYLLKTEETNAYFNSKIPVENKTMKFENFAELKEDKISRRYLIQLQTQIACCGSPFGIIIFNGIEDDDYADPLLYEPNFIKQVAFKIERDDEMVSEILNRAKYFLWCVEFKREPSEADYQARSI